MNLETVFCGVKLKNPIVAASTDMSRELSSFRKLAESGVGAIITKSVTDATALQSKSIARFDIRDINQNAVKGDLPDNYIFFSRGGSMLPMEVFAEKAPEMLEIAKANDVVLIGSISSSKKENWVRYAKEMEKIGFPMLELNFGNPHGEAADGKLGFLIGQSPELCAEIVKAITEEVKIPVIAKLTPQLFDITEVAMAVEKAGASAVTVMHRFQGLVMDIDSETVALGGYAAIGGPWMKPVSLANVAKTYLKTDNIAICGSNGADTGRDVAEFVAAGADVVQIGSTLMLRGSGEVKKILRDFEAILDSKNVRSVSDFKGFMAKKIVTYKNLSELPEREASHDIEKCKNCKDKPCVDRCYFGALKLEHDELKEDKTLCTGCGMCSFICPEDAVTLKTII